MEDALRPGARHVDRSAKPISAGGVIRTLGVSLLAVAALAVGVVLSKQRQERGAPVVPMQSGEARPVTPSLDAIRSAGF